MPLADTNEINIRQANRDCTIKVHGGTDAAPKTHPWQVEVGPKYLCGGTIISSNVSNITYNVEVSIRKACDPLYKLNRRRSIQAHNQKRYTYMF